MTEFDHIYVVLEGDDGPYLSSDFGSSMLSFSPDDPDISYYEVWASLSERDGQIGVAGDVTDLNFSVYTEEYLWSGDSEFITFTSVYGYAYGPIGGVTANGEALFENVWINSVEIYEVEMSYDYGEGGPDDPYENTYYETIGREFTFFLTNQSYEEGALLPEMVEGAALVCFAEGTRIATPTGEVAVETLQIGDLVLSATGASVPVKWLGRQSVANRFHPAERMAPVTITAGALGAGVPHSDLTVTNDHGMILEGYVIHAGALVNGDTIYKAAARDLPAHSTYYHIETADHSVILANGAASETFIDNLSRQVFDNFDNYQALYGEEVTIPAMRLPRVLGPRQLPARVRARLDAQRSRQVA